jgi:hypothetical protein
MAQVKVQYTHKQGNHYNPHERIQGLAGNGGTGWYRSEAQVLSDIQTGLNSYYVTVGGHSVDVVRATHNGRLYLRRQLTATARTTS